MLFYFHISKLVAECFVQLCLLSQNNPLKRGHHATFMHVSGCVWLPKRGSPFFCCVFFCSGMPTSEETPPLRLPPTHPPTRWKHLANKRRTQTRTSSHDIWSHRQLRWCELVCLEEVTGGSITLVTLHRHTEKWGLWIVLRHDFEKFTASFFKNIKWHDSFIWMHFYFFLRNQTRFLLDLHFHPLWS